jgi:excisionase family DNA binding protein
MDNFTLYQASKYCGVSPKTISQWIDEGRIEAFRTVEGHRRIQRKDLFAFLRRQGIPILHSTEKDPDVKKILVIDDDKLIVETIVASLEEEPYPYEILSASDGFEAALQVNRFKPDLLILDIMMPDVNGHEVCKQIKENPETSGTKIIVLSAYLDDENHQKMRECGAEACFSKPLPLRSLKQEISRMLDVAAPDTEEP